MFWLFRIYYDYTVKLNKKEHSKRKYPLNLKPDLILLGNYIVQPKQIYLTRAKCLYAYNKIMIICQLDFNVSRM